MYLTIALQSIHNFVNIDLTTFIKFAGNHMKTYKNSLKAIPFVFFAMVPCSNASDITNGLVAHYKFDDCSAVDSLGAFSGTLQNAPTCVLGVQNKALSFGAIKGGGTKY
jgi:hypothetical protein